jgi:hypothetical protein
MAEDQDNNSVAYLMALKRSSPAATGAAPERNPDTAVLVNARAAPAAFAEPKHYGGSEKRRSTRYKCVGSAEISQESTGVRIWATFQDVSVHGCYVEASSNYPVGTALGIKLQMNAIQVTARGVVRVTYPSLGMGIAFREMSAENRTRLEELIRSIPRSTVATTAPGLVSGLQEPVPIMYDPEAALRGLVDFFETQQTLPRAQFLRILRSSQTPRR